MISQMVKYGEQIAISVAHEMGAEWWRVTGPQRSYDIVKIRRVIARKLREETTLSLPEIGRILGGRHHATIINLLRPDANV